MCNCLSKDDWGKQRKFQFLNNNIIYIRIGIKLSYFLNNLTIKHGDNMEKLLSFKKPFWFKKQQQCFDVCLTSLSSQLRE